jgi:drug/metabolite transporter (DMT)-like permease
LENLVSLNFTKGDRWILLAALSFAVYNTMVRKKPSAISAINFLFVTFSFGTLLLLPFYLWELNNTEAVKWKAQLILIILYLGAGASVICFWLWNIAIGKLGAGRTALFGNLIPVFSSAEAAILLNEQFTWIHIVSMLLVFAGILMANWKVLRR